MGKPALPPRFRVEDFEEQFRDLIDTLAGELNAFNNDVYNQLNGNITFDNLDRQLVPNLVVQMDASGAVINKPQVKLTLKSKISGISVINAQNNTNVEVYPTSHPFISFTVGTDKGTDKIITIKNITGLQANSKYTLTVEIIGSKL